MVTAYWLGLLVAGFWLLVSVRLCVRVRVRVHVRVTVRFRVRVWFSVTVRVRVIFYDYWLLVTVTCYW